MNHAITIHSLEELGQYAGLVVQEEQPQLPITVETETANDLASLAAAASRAVSQLQELVEQDAVARREAELALSQHHRLQDEIGQLERIERETGSVEERASALAEAAFDPQCRARAVEVGDVVRAVASATQAALARLRDEAATLAERDDVARLLREEQERAEAAQQEEVERQRLDGLREQVARVEALLRDGQQNEAEELLGRLVSEQPNDSRVASSIDNLRRRIWGVKTVHIEEALREARKLHRREPREAIARLDTLDLLGMPEELVRQVYGCWLDACRRLKLNGALLYSPAFGKGAVLIPADDDRLEVISAIGLPRWQAGATFSASGLRAVRPLS